MTASTLPISSPVRWSLMIWYGWNVYVRIWLPNAISFFSPGQLRELLPLLLLVDRKSRARRMRIAVSRFLSWERSFWHATTMPARQVRDAHGGVRGVDALTARARRAVDVHAEVLVLDRRPRRPRPRGSPATEAKDVWRRLDASKGEMRISRCTPISPLR